MRWKDFQVFFAEDSNRYLEENQPEVEQPVFFPLLIPT